MSERLICPNSGKPCRFLSYCAANKEAADGGGDNLTSMLEERLPDAIRTAIDRAGFCATERVSALIGVADARDASDLVGIRASIMAGQIEAGQDVFSAPAAPGAA